MKKKLFLAALLLGLLGGFSQSARADDPMCFICESTVESVRLSCYADPNIDNEHCDEGCDQVLEEECGPLCAVVE